MSHPMWVVVVGGWVCPTRWVIDWQGGWMGGRAIVMIIVVRVVMAHGGGGDGDHCDSL